MFSNETKSHKRIGNVEIPVSRDPYKMVFPTSRSIT